MPPAPPSANDPPSPEPWAAGAVTRLGTPVPARAAPPELPQPPPDRRLWWFAGAAGTVLVVGLAVVLALVLTGNPDPLRPGQAAPEDVRPPLARACPAPTSTPDPGTSPGDPAPPAEPRPAPTGPRTADPEAGISYRSYDAPWQPWNTVWRAGTLRVPYRVGQHFVTERDYDGASDYHASILSAAVPAADNDALVLDIECVGRQVAADVRAEYYPQPNRLEPVSDERRTIDGRPAWVTVFRLHFNRRGLAAKSELAAVACIDVGRPTAAILYVSIPDTHRQYDWIVENALASVRVM